MCNVLLENIHRVLVYVRSDICNNKNIDLVKILSAGICENISNVEVVKQIGDISPELKKQLIFRNDEKYRLNEDAENYILSLLQIIYSELVEKNYDFAYDMIDALHVFPQVVIANDKKQIKSYWKVYVKPIIKRIRIKGYDLKEFKSCKM